MRAIRMPIACCGECWTAYDFGQWQRLELVASPPELRDAETVFRRCKCGHVFSVHVPAVHEWDLYLPAEEYYALFPNSDRVPQEVPTPVALGKAARLVARLWRPFMSRMTRRT